MWRGDTDHEAERGRIRCSEQKTAEGEREDTEQLNDRDSVRKRGKIRWGRKIRTFTVQNQTPIKDRERDCQTKGEEL